MSISTCKFCDGAVSVGMPQVVAFGSEICGTAKTAAKCFSPTGAAYLE
jgi:hypothetical protein